jgi:hypothetical protein
MAKPILGVVAGLAVWLILASVAGLILRAAWPAYAQVATAMTFTLSMKIARLAIGALATVAAGVVARAVARSTTAGVVVGGPARDVCPRACPALGQVPGLVSPHAFCSRLFR